MILVDLFLTYYFVFLVLGMSTMKENKEKEVVGEENRPETHAQIRPSVGEKWKPLSKHLDIGNLPSRRGKKAKHTSSQAAKPNSPPPQSSIRVYDVDSSTPTETTPSKTPPSKTTAPATSQPFALVPTNIIENENLAWERFQKAVTNEDINVCYDMSLKDFEHSGVHDLFKVRIIASSLKTCILFVFIFIIITYDFDYFPLTFLYRVCQSS